MLLLVDDIQVSSIISQINDIAFDLHSQALEEDSFAKAKNIDNDNISVLITEKELPIQPLTRSFAPKSNEKIKKSNFMSIASSPSSSHMTEEKVADMLMKANKKVYESSDRFQQVAYASGKKSNANGYNTLPKKLMEYDKINTKPTETSSSTTTLKNNTDGCDNKFTITIPHEKDSLFWSFYNLVYGTTSKAYEFIQNTCETERDTRFQFIDVIRSNKDIIKPLKLSRTSIEENIAHDKHLNIRSVIALTHSLKCMNIVYVSGRTFHEVMLDDSLPCHLIQKHIDKEKYGYCMNITMEQVKEVRESLWYMENMDKPMKSISSYKADDLRCICTQLQLEFKDDEKCTKPVMYERIMQYLSA